VTTPDDDELFDEGPPTVGDTLRRWQYTLTPTLYVDESSDVTDLLWQQTLEQRAIRGWLIVLCTLVAIGVLVVIVPQLM
jgi:hypothetical protein